MICGIDLGSRSVKLVLADADGNITDKKVFSTVDFYREYGRVDEAGLQIDFAELGIEGIEAVASTGYGRNTLDIVGSMVIPELKAHVLGVIEQTGLTDFTLIDLGGQDSKVIKVRKGRMADFATNDKCAASTGRYLENMAAVLNISMEELSRYSEDPIELNSTCAIFGESELIGRIVEGHPTAVLAAGVNASIVKRIKPMVRPLLSDTLVLTGGVALGTAMKKLLEEAFGREVIVPAEPQLNGAIGCIRAVRMKQEKGK
ncbi:MAG: 2-hydroxyglutaryl-CoA dehydratase [Selenomonadales bacterium]|nr:2-hydroxyglutaryl-CoA dehydratase [Selenomonadales bacterium]